MKKYFLILCMLCCTLFVQAQGELEIDSLAPYQDTTGWYDFPEDSNVSFSYVQSHLKELLGLGSYDSLVQIECETDTLYFTHCKYSQYYKGYEVEGAIVSLHALGNMLLTLHGKWVNDLSIASAPYVDEEDALQAALDHLGAEEYLWQDTSVENELKAEMEDTSATYYPKGRFIIVQNNNDEFIGSNFTLAYEFDIVSIEPNAHKLVYVDANTGSYYNERNMLFSCNSPGTCITLTDGLQSFETNTRGFPYNDYILEDCRGPHSSRGIQTKWGWLGGKWAFIFNIDDGDNSWTDVDERAATTSHWACQKAWDYFKYIHNRYGTTKNGRETRVHVGNSATTTTNSYYDLDRVQLKNRLYIGYINGIHCASPDVVGHEYTHGVTQATAGLLGYKEPGALNESFSDIFGTAVERAIRGSAFDWIQGESYGGSRSLSNPKYFSHPDTYHGPYWQSIDTSFDDGGIHANAGVPNKWFYLLSEGDTLNNKTVDGIGFNPAIHIAYQTLIYYLHPKSQFIDARMAALAAARDLYGKCSYYTRQCQEAWNAVKVGKKATPTDFCAQIHGVKSICLNQASFFAADFFPNATYTWTVPSGWTTWQNSNYLFVVPNSGSSASISVSVSWNSQTTSAGFNVNLVSCSMQHSSSGTPQKEVVDMVLFPNPTNSLLNIQLSGFQSENDAGNSNIKICDLSGKSIKSGSLYGRVGEIDIADLANGMYWLNIRNKDTLLTRKFVVSK